MFPGACRLIVQGIILVPDLLGTMVRNITIPRWAGVIGSITANFQR
jgi:hypothetical protein